MSDKLNVSEVDFTQIKQNLINYLKNQSQFSDYNFDGAAINVLLDILAYNTHYAATYANLGFAETFLDSAAQRGSVVSRAKEVGYLPRSKSSAKATIRVSFAVSGNPDQYILPKNTKFAASLNGTTYVFVTDHDCLFVNNSGIFTNTIQVVQGNFNTYQYMVNLNDASQRFIVPSKDADMNYLSVLFKEFPEIGDFVPFSNIKDVQLGDLNGSTEVYFLEEAFDEYYEVYFGDGIVGKKLSNNNIVELQYLITDGPLANGAQQFVLSSTIPEISSLTITTILPSSGGDDKESVDSIKFLAPFYYQSQGRAVTENDYGTLIKNTYSDVTDVAVWGGEKNDPPFYGKVFIAIRPKNEDILSVSIKNAISNDIISRFNIVSIRPEIVDPDYIFVSVSTTVTYNGRLYSKTSNINLQSNITQNINDFFSSQVNKFGAPLYFSKLTSSIDNTSSLILNSVTNLTLQKQAEIFSGISGTYKFSFNNSISPNSVRSNQILIDNVVWSIKDVPDTTGITGTLTIYRTTNQNQTIYLNQAAGTVDYNTGLVTVKNVRIDNIVDDPIGKKLVVTISPGSFLNETDPSKVFTDYNVYPNGRDQIIVLKDNSVVVTLIADNSK